MIDRRALVLGALFVVALGGLTLALTRPGSLSVLTRSVTRSGPSSASPSPAIPAASTGGPAPSGLAADIKTSRSGSAANELGMVPILEYHGIAAKESRWVRHAKSFEDDLEWLHNHGYVSATVLDMVAGFRRVPAGMKPVVLTFDDARGDQFVASGIGPSGLAIPSPRCGVGILMAFAKRHPDFGARASFYLLPTFFEEDRWAAAKLRYLVENDFELGNHTWSHLMLGRADPSKIRDELDRLQTAVRKALGPNGATFRTRTLALPNGSEPKTASQLRAALGGPRDPFHHEALLLVGANPAHSPFSRSFDPHRLARIQAIDSEWQRWFGRKSPRDRTGIETFEPYVSDGDPQSVTFPARLAEQLAVGRLHGAKPQSMQAEIQVPITMPTAPGNLGVIGPATANLMASASGSTLPIGGLGPASASPTATGGTAVHPGYNEALPTGGTYQAGRIFHTVQKDQSFDGLFWKYLKFTDAYTGPELRDRISKHNSFKHQWVSPGQTFEVPGVRKARPRPISRGVSASFEARGIYCTATTASFDRIFRLARALKAVGGNTVVFDVKDETIAYESGDPKVRELSVWDHSIRDLPKLVSMLHEMGLHVVARAVLFNDPLLAKRRPDLAIKSKRTGRVWLQNGKRAWVDPGHPEVQDYNLRLAKEVAQSGVDEIQYDYVRFPAEGDTRDNRFVFDESKTAKHEIITGFLRRSREALKPYNVLISIDVFGVMAWQKGVDLKVTGQKLESMARYVDIISPMVYPSHFYGPFDGYAHPANQPYYFVSQGVERVRRVIGPNGPVIRPWVQAFPYMVPSYNPAYVSTQLRASRDGRARGWMLWNASNKYDIAFQGVANWNRVARATPMAPVIVKGDPTAAESAAPKIGLSSI